MISSSGQMDKEQALFSQDGVGLGHYDSTSHERACPVGAEDSGSTETMRPLQYGFKLE